MPGGKRPAAGWNEFQIERQEAGFSIQMIRRQIANDGITVNEVERLKLS
jgi:hypothetical protein